MRLIQPLQKNDNLLEDIRAHANEPGVKLWWLGQSGYLISFNNIYLLVDPYLSDSLTKKYQDTNKPHVRISEQVIKPQQLNFINIVSSSHNHTDHLDGETLIPLINANPGIQMVIPEANRKFVTDRINMPVDFPIGLNDNQSVEIQSVKFSGIAAAHNEIDRDEKGNCRYLGYIIEIGGKKIYHSGDTLLYSGMIESLATHQPDVAILPINGNDPSRGVAGNLSIDDAILLGKSIGAGLTIPCHYDMFAFNTADVNQFSSRAGAAGVRFRVLQLGEGLMLD